MAVPIDARVQELLARGDPRGAAVEAIRGVGPDVLRYLRAVLRDEADAADAFSLFAEGVWKGLGSFRGESSLRTWALRLAVHSAGKIRNEAWKRRVRRFESGEASALAEEVRTTSRVRVERQSDRLEKLRQALTPHDQALLVLRIDQRLSWSEIADVLSGAGQVVGVNTLCKRFERIKTRLAQMAKQQGLLEQSSLSDLSDSSTDSGPR